MSLKDNPLFQVAIESKDVRLYVPAQDTDYHLSRYVAAGAQNIYSASGATKETITAITDKIIELCNSDQAIRTTRTDIAILANNLKYRLKYPVDEDCAIRMGAIYCFLEDEDPNTVHDVFTRRKIELAKKDPDLYAFFLNMGQQNTPAWTEYEQDLNDTEYLRGRQEGLNALQPQPTQ